MLARLFVHTLRVRVGLTWASFRSGLWWGSALGTGWFGGEWLAEWLR